MHGEWPASPGDVVGMPQGTTHGPTIYVFSAGPWIGEQPLHITVLIPLSPLSPQTTYTASATVRSKAGTTITDTWSFRTA